MKKNDMIKCATKITKQVFDCSLVISSRSMHELRELVDTVSYISTCET